MLFGKKKKPKIDPKVRFQNRQFNQKLQQARTFKRTARPIPEGGFERFLKRIGLSSRWKQIFVALIVLGAVYLVYAPNFLTVQSFTIEGLSDTERPLVESAVQDSLNRTPFYNPQRNLLFASKNRIRQAVLSVSGIDSVEKITKNFKQKSITITARPKHERFLVRTSDAVFDIYNDGTIKGRAGLERDSWANVQNPAMAKVDLGAQLAAQDTRQFFSSETVGYMIQLQEALKGIAGSPLSHFSIRIPELKQQQELQEEQARPEAIPSEVNAGEITPSGGDLVADEPVLPVVDIRLPINADELDVVLQKGNTQRKFKVIVDTKENPEALVQRLNLLLSQTAPDRYNNLSYVDLRIQARAYICLLNTVCNK